MRLNNYIVSPHDIQISGKDYVYINMHTDMHTYGLVVQSGRREEGNIKKNRKLYKINVKN